MSKHMRVKPSLATSLVFGSVADQRCWRIDFGACCGFNVKVPRSRQVRASCLSAEWPSPNNLCCA